MAGDSGGPNQGNPLRKDELLEALAATIEGLPANLRTAFVLRYVRGVPTRRIARRMNQSPSQVQLLLSHALVECRTRLRSLGVDLDEGALPSATTVTQMIPAGASLWQRWTRWLSRRLLSQRPMCI